MHHTVPVLGAGCSGFSLTDLLPMATGHADSGPGIVIGTGQEGCRLATDNFSHPHHRQIR
jgi:hypothetical protein